MNTPYFLDTNVLMRYFTGSGDINPDNRKKAHESKVLLDRIENGDEKVVTSALVIFETIFLLERSYKVPKDNIRDAISGLLLNPTIQLAGKTTFFNALDIYVAYNISFADAFNVAVMQSNDLTHVYSWDADFDRIPGITRVLPPG